MYVINGHVIDGDRTGAQPVLAAAHAAGTRPRCMCHGADGVDMYIAKVSGRYLIKRMPGTGSTHDPLCSSYAPPPEVSGLAHVLGKAVKEQPGSTRITLGFPLTHHGRHTTAVADPDGDDIAGDPTKLTLRGLLHLLWDDAGFTRWTPGMLGKRNWATIRKYLLAAAEDKLTNRTPLINRLWVPETFNSDHKPEIIARRTATLSRMVGGGSRRLMLTVGEIKTITPTTSGAAVLFKHVPDYPFHLLDAVHARFAAGFGAELVLRANNPGAHLIGIATFGLRDDGEPEIEQIAAMTVNENWIPFDTPAEQRIVDLLTDHRRRFVKSLRYDVPRGTALATLTLIDTRPVTACYLADSGDEQRRAIDALVAASQLAAWITDSDLEVPPPPPSQSRGTGPDSLTLDLDLGTAANTRRPSIRSHRGAGRATSENSHPRSVPRGE